MQPYFAFGPLHLLVLPCFRHGLVLLVVILFGTLLPPCSAQQPTASLSGGWGFSVVNCGPGAVYLTGTNSQGQLGDGMTTNVHVPQADMTGSVVRIAAAGQAFTLFLLADSTVMATGRNAEGQLGIGSNLDQITPQSVPGLNNVIAIAGGFRHALFLLSDGTVRACGQNIEGALGDGTNVSSNVPVQVAIDSVVAIAGGEDFSLFLRADGSVLSCGGNGYGRLGTGDPGNRNTPAPVLLPGPASAIVAGRGQALFLVNDSVWASGWDSWGQIGFGGNSSYNNPPMKLSTIGGVVAMGAGELHSAYLLNDGHVWVTGGGGQGQLGTGLNSDTNVPVEVPGLTDVIAIACGDRHTLFLKDDLSLLACGYNGQGQLGDSTTLDRWTPTPMALSCASSTEMPELVPARTLSVYPNPSAGPITVDLSAFRPGNVSIRLINAQGRILLDGRSCSKGTTCSIDLTDIPAGLYMLELTDHDSQQLVMIIRD